MCIRLARGYSLIELLLAIAVLGILSSLAYSSYQTYRDRVDIAQAISDISTINTVLIRYFVTNMRYPDSLAQVNINLADPWGTPYYYLNIANVKGKGKLRKDKNLVPINSDYDLYSAGKDTKTVSPLTAKASRDDIIRANNGQFVGKAEDF